MVRFTQFEVPQKGLEMLYNAVYIRFDLHKVGRVHLM